MTTDLLSGEAWLSATSGLAGVVVDVSGSSVSDGRLLSPHAFYLLPPRHLLGGGPLPVHGQREVKSQDSFYSTYFHHRTV